MEKFYIIANRQYWRKMLKYADQNLRLLFYCFPSSIYLKVDIHTSEPAEIQSR